MPRGLFVSGPLLSFLFSSLSLPLCLFLSCCATMDEQDYAEEVGHEVELPNFAYRDKDFENEPVDSASTHSAQHSAHSGLNSQHSQSNHSQSLTVTDAQAFHYFLF